MRDPVFQINDSVACTDGLVNNEEVPPLPEPEKLCWEYANSANTDEDATADTYRPHKAVRSQTTETDLFNACYQTTTTINFFGREIVKTITTCI
jgi:hypothetical protein